MAKLIHLDVPLGYLILCRFLVPIHSHTNILELVLKKLTLVNENLINRNWLETKQIAIQIFAWKVNSVHNMNPIPALNTSVLSNICGKEEYSAISSHLLLSWMKSYHRSTQIHEGIYFKLNSTWKISLQLSSETLWREFCSTEEQSIRTIITTVQQFWTSVLTYLFISTLHFNEN